MKTTVPCSNCMTPLRLDTRTMTITVTIPAAGRGSKRTPTRTVVADVTDDGGLLLWDAPCCPDYGDSLDLTEEST